MLQLLQSSQVQAPRARSGIRGLLQATGQRLVQHRATTMWPIGIGAAACTLFCKVRAGCYPVEMGYVTPRRRRKINYPSPSRRFSGKRADTSGPSSLLNCAFQSDPLNNMNRPATRRGRISVATAQMP